MTSCPARYALAPDTNHPSCRGPGELLGRRQSGQSGLGCLRAAELPRDTPLLDAARATAKAQLTSLGLDPGNW